MEIQVLAHISYIEVLEPPPPPKSAKQMKGPVYFKMMADNKILKIIFERPLKVLHLFSSSSKFASIDAQTIFLG